MAVVKLSALFTNIRGRFGGGVFRNWKGQTVLGVLPTSVANPSTVDQEKARNILATASKLWAALAATPRSQWRAVATALSAAWKDYGNPVGARSIIYPPRGPYTGLGALTSVAGLLGSVDDWVPGDAVPAAPVNVTAPSIPSLGTLSGDTTVGLVIPFTDPASWGINAHAGWVRVFVKNEQGFYHTQLVGSVAAAVETLTITTMKPRGGGAPAPLAIGVYVVQLDAVNMEGLRSAPSAIAEFSLPAGI